MDLCVFEQYILVCIGMNLHSVLGLHKTIMLACCVLARNIQQNQEGVGEMKFVSCYLIKELQTFVLLPPLHSKGVIC